jgi:hypothetical protein
MADVVEEYIFIKKGVRVRIDLGQIIVDMEQVNKLIDAFNHVKKEGYY